MSVTDKRVVEFEFDNSKFDKRIKQSRKSIEDLKTSLNMDGISASLDNISAKAIAKVTIVGNVVNRFINRFISLGKSLIKSLSTDQITNGWSKFEDKTKAVATMASQTIKVAGKELDNYSEKMAAITEQLEKLNWFTDQTSYNFTDMVDNISKFTAAGQDLDASVNAMMGIANWAAISGQGITNASRAMYNLAQALSKGNVQLIDYKSIQNANMDTQEFRQVVLDTAVALGELTKEGENYISKAGSKFTKNQFTEELKSKWFTSDVLMKTLEKYSSAVERAYEISEETGSTAAYVLQRYSSEFEELGLKAFKAAQEARSFKDAINATKDAVSTGWLNTAENIFGNYDDSKVLWSDLADSLWNVFAASGDVRNQILKTWNALEGRNDLFEHGEKSQGAFWNIFDSIVALKKLVTNSWEEIFPSSQYKEGSARINELANKYKKVTSELKKYTDKIKETLKDNQVLTNIFNGLFSALKVGTNIVKGLVYAFNPLYVVVKSMISVLINSVGEISSELSFTSRIIEVIYNISSKINDVLTALFTTVNLPEYLSVVISAVRSLGKYLGMFASSVKSAFNVITKNGSVISDAIKDIIYAIKDFVDITSNKLNDIDNSKFANGLVSFANSFGSVIGKLIGHIASFIQYIPKVLNYINQGIKDGKLLQNIFKGIFDILAFIVNEFKVLLSYISDSKAIEVISDALIVTKDKIKEAEIVEKSLDIIKNIIEQIKLLLINTLNLVRMSLTLLNNVIVAVTKFVELLSVFFSKLANLNTNDFYDTVKVLLAVAALLAVTVVVLIKIFDFVYVINTTIASLNNLAYSLGKSLKKKAIAALLSSVADVVKSIGQSMLELAVAIAIISYLKPEDIWKAVGIMMAMTSAIAALIFVAGKFGKGLSSMGASFSLFNKEEGKGSSLFSGKRTSSTNNPFISIAAFITTFATAIIEVAVAMKILDSIQGDGFTRGLIIIGIFAGFITALLGLNALIQKSNKQANMNASFPGMWSLIGFAILLRVFASTVEKLSAIDYNKAWPGLASIGGFMVLVIFLAGVTGKAATKSSNMTAALKQIKGVMWSLVGFAGAMKTLASINWEQYGVAIVSILSVMTIMTGMVILIDKFAKTNNNNAEIIKSLAVFNASLLAFALGIAMLSALDFAKMMGAIVPIMLLLGSYAGMLILVTKYGKVTSTAKLNKTISSLSLFNASLIAFALGIAMLSTLDFWKMVGTMAPIALLLAAEAGLLITVTKYGKFSYTSIDKTIKSLAIVNASLVALALSMALLSLISPQKLIAPAIAISGLLLALGVVLATLSLVGSKTSKAFKPLKTLIPIITGLIAVLTTLVYLSYMPIEQVMAASVAVSVVLLALAALIGSISLMAGLKVEPLQILAFSVALVTLSAAMIAFAVSGKMLQDVNLGKLALSMLVFSAAVLVMAGVAALVSSVSGVLAVMTLTMLATAVSLMLISTAMQQVSANLAPFVQSFADNFDAIMTLAADFIVSILNTIKNTAPLIMQALGELIISFLTVIKEQAPEILGTIVDLITMVLVTISTHIGEWASIMYETIITFLTVLNTYLPTIVELLGDSFAIVLIGMMDSVMKHGKELINKAIDLLLWYIDTLGKTIRDRSAEFMDTFIDFGWNLMLGLVKGIGEGLARLLEKLGVVGEKMADKLRDVLGIHSPSRLTQEMGMYLDEGLAKGVEDNIDNTADRAAEAMTTVITGIENALTEDIDEDALTIRPVVDLSNVESGAKDINSLMNSISGSDLSVSTGLAMDNNSSFNRVQESNKRKNQNGNITNSSTTENYYSTFNVTADDPEDFARQADILLQKNRNRAKLAKGGA